MTQILHSAIRYPPARGGVESYVEDIVGVPGLPPQSVVTSDLTDHLSWRRLEQRDIAARDDHVRTLCARQFRPTPGYPWLAALGKHVNATDAAIVHAHAMYYASLDVPLMRAPRGAALVVNLYAHRRSGWRQIPYTRWLNRTLRRADCIVHISEFERRLTHALLPGVKHLPQVVVPPLIRTSEAVEADRHLVVAVGRQDVGKGSEDLPVLAQRLAQRRPGTKLVAVGGASSHTDWLLARAAESGGALEVLPNADHATLASLVARAAVFVTPTRYEAFGIAAVEAAGMGVPVVAYDHAALPTVLSSSQLTTARPFDPEELADAVLDVLGREEDLVDRRARASSVQLEFGPDVWAANWRSIYGQYL